MPLNKAKLEEDIYKLIKDQSDNQDEDQDPVEAQKAYARKFANVIDAYVRSGDVTVDVTTVGSATTQKGTGKGKVT